MSGASPKQLEQHVRDLEAFRGAYAPYSDGREVSKQAIIERIAAAQRALDVARVNLEVADPPMLGAHRQVYRGLTNLVFLDERPGFGMAAVSGGPSIADTLIETVDTAIASLRDEIAQEQARRRNPLYWVDLGLRTLLRIPAYVVGLIIGKTAIEIDRSAWGFPLRLLAVAADVLAVYLAGRELGVW